MYLRLEATTEPTGLRIVDSIERRRMGVRTPTPVEPEPVPTDGFSYPVDAAASVETKALQFDRLDDAYVRNADWDIVTAFGAPGSTELDPGAYTVEISGPIKLYCRVEGAIAIDAGSDSIALEFPSPRRVTVGARSYHQHPAATITSPPDPESLMTAVTATSSALKTTSCERSYPTLRGHPPLLELGTELAVPDGIASPDTDVTLVLPRDRRYVYTAAPLAFYLGADAVPGSEARIETPTLTHPLGDGRAFEDEVATVLKRTLFLDTVVRTEGIYQVSLHERAQIEPALPFDVESMYGKPLHEQLAAYLEVPFDQVSDHVPTWVLTAHLPASPESAEALPFVVNDLGVVRAPRGRRYDAPEDIIDDYVPMDRRPSGPDDTRGDPETRSAESDHADDGRTLVDPIPLSESIEHVWFDADIPVGASKATMDVFRNRLDRDAESDVIDITLVCNDDRMLDEHETLEGIYGNREDLPFDVTSHFGLSRDSFADLLEGDDSDFLHYIGHATPDGLQCPDGKLDVESLDAVGVDVFFLNACDAYEQALALTRRGALGGVGTLGDVVNEHAVDAGKLVAQLLNEGYPLRAAMNLVREYTVIGDQYLIVGDGSVDVTQSTGGPPTVYHIRTGDDGTYDVSATTYPTRVFRIGSYFDVTTDKIEEKFLLPGTTSTMTMTREELREYLLWFSGPLWIDGTLEWTRPLENVV